MKFKNVVDEVIKKLSVKQRNELRNKKNLI